jgi:hypothetical protein
LVRPLTNEYCGPTQDPRRTHEDGRWSQQYVAELLTIPNRYMVLAVMAVGYPAETKAPHKKETLKFDQLHQDRFGTKKGTR